MVFAMIPRFIAELDWNANAVYILRVWKLNDSFQFALNK